MSEPVVEFNGDFSEPGATAVPWADAEAVLAKSEMFWLSTVRRDGRPHVTPLPTVYPRRRRCTSAPASWNRRR